VRPHIVCTCRLCPCLCHPSPIPNLSSWNCSSRHHRGRSCVSKFFAWQCRLYTPHGCVDRSQGPCYPLGQTPIPGPQCVLNGCKRSLRVPVPQYPLYQVLEALPMRRCAPQPDPVVICAWYASRASPPDRLRQAVARCCRRRPWGIPCPCLRQRARGFDHRPQALQGYSCAPQTWQQPGHRHRLVVRMSLAVAQLNCCNGKPPTDQPSHQPLVLQRARGAGGAYPDLLPFPHIGPRQRCLARSAPPRQGAGQPFACKATSSSARLLVRSRCSPPSSGVCQGA